MTQEGIPITWTTCAPPASAYGPHSLRVSKLHNYLAMLFVPMIALLIFIRIFWRRKGL